MHNLHEAFRVSVARFGALLCIIYVKHLSFSSSVWCFAMHYFFRARDHSVGALQLGLLTRHAVCMLSCFSWFVVIHVINSGCNSVYGELCFGPLAVYFAGFLQER